jgi:predicted nucleotidyltransferase
MRREDALAVLAAHKHELTRFHVKSLALFGSVARDEAGPESDVDVLVEFDETPNLLKLIALEHHLSEMLGTKVDLVMHRSLRPAVRRRVAEDLVTV